MAHFGWTRLAYLLCVLTVLAALIRLENSDTASRPLASDPPSVPTTAEPSPAAKSGLREPAEPTPRRGAGRAAFVNRRESAAAGSPVFYRPIPDPSRASRLRFSAACSDRRIVFPLPKTYLSSYENTWGMPRPQGGHEGTDLMAPAGTPEYAVTDGSVVPVSGANANGWNSLGGYAVMIEAAYSVGPIRKGDLFYYAHLDRKSALPVGAKVRAGQIVGYAGDTGQGPEVTRGLFPPHLHLGWYDASGERSNLASGAMNPYPLLEWIRASGGSNARYCGRPESAVPIPSIEGRLWPARRDPGVSPDLDTGSNDPTPSPAVEKRSRARSIGPPVKTTPVRAAPRDGRRPPQPPVGKPSSFGDSPARSEHPGSPEKIKVEPRPAPAPRQRWDGPAPENNPDPTRQQRSGEKQEAGNGDTGRDRVAESEKEGPEYAPHPGEQTSPSEHRPSPHPEATPAPAAPEEPAPETTGLASETTTAG